MTREEITARLKEIFRQIFEDDDLEINEETTPDDLPDWRSLEHVRLCIEVGQAFGLQIKPSQLMRLTSVGAFADMLARELSSNPQS